MDEEVDVEGSPRTAENAPAAYVGGLDEPMEAATLNRSSFRRQQVHVGSSVNDSTMDRIGALDSAASRVMVRPHRRCSCSFCS